MRGYRKEKSKTVRDFEILKLTPVPEKPIGPEKAPRPKRSKKHGIWRALRRKYTRKFLICR